jgi:putative transposase
MRKNRLLKKGATYHVGAKINRDEMIFEYDEIKAMFMDVVKEAKKKYDFNLKNFTIMNNHIHFLIEPLKNANLSRIMQWILSVFAIHYNAIHKLRGHVWMNRFWSRIIEDVAQLVKVFKYINENPVKAGLAKKSEDYKYGGMYFIIRKIFDLVSKPDFKYC